MTKIGLFYGTQTSNTQTAAETIQKEFGGDGIVTLHDISQAEPGDLESYDNIIVGCPTWNIGELQSDWDRFYDELSNINQPELTEERIKDWVAQLKVEFGL